LILYEHTQKREAATMRFNAMLHGLKIDDDDDEEEGAILTDQPRTMKKQSGFQFGDPEEYAKMTPEDRKKETERMMGLHKQWAKTPSTVAPGHKKLPMGE